MPGCPGPASSRSRSASPDNAAERRVHSPALASAASTWAGVLAWVSALARASNWAGAILREASGLHGLTVVDSLDVVGNGGLQTLWGAHHLELCGNDGLTSLSAINLAVDRLTVIYNDVLGDAAGRSYAASLGVSTTKIARNSPPPYTDLSPCHGTATGPATKRTRAT